MAERQTARARERAGERERAREGNYESKEIECTWLFQNHGHVCHIQTQSFYFRANSRVWSSRICGHICYTWPNAWYQLNPWFIKTKHSAFQLNGKFPINCYDMRPKFGRFKCHTHLKISLVKQITYDQQTSKQAMKQKKQYRFASNVRDRSAVGVYGCILLINSSHAVLTWRSCCFCCKKGIYQLHWFCSIWKSFDNMRPEICLGNHQDIRVCCIVVYCQ